MTKQIFLLGGRNTSYMTHRKLDAAIGLLPTGGSGARNKATYRYVSSGR